MQNAREQFLNTLENAIDEHVTTLKETMGHVWATDRMDELMHRMKKLELHSRTTMARKCGNKSYRGSENTTMPNNAHAMMHEITPIEVAASDQHMRLFTKVPSCCKLGLCPAFEEHEMQDKHAGATDRMHSGIVPDVMIEWAKENAAVIRKQHNEQGEKATCTTMTNKLRKEWDAIMAINIIRAEGLQSVARLRMEEQNKHCVDKHGKKEESDKIDNDMQRKTNEMIEDQSSQGEKTNKSATCHRSPVPCKGCFCKTTACLKSDIARGVVLAGKETTCAKCNDMIKMEKANNKVEQLLTHDDNALDAIEKVEQPPEARRMFELGKIAADVVDNEMTWPMPIKKTKRKQTSAMQRKITRSLAHTLCMTVQGAQEGPDGTPSLRETETQRAKAATTCDANCHNMNNNKVGKRGSNTCGNTKTCKNCKRLCSDERHEDAEGCATCGRSEKELLHKTCKTCMCKQLLMMNRLENRLDRLNRKMADANNEANDKEETKTQCRKKEEQMNDITNITNKTSAKRRRKSGNKLAKKKMEALESTTSTTTKNNDKHIKANAKENIATKTQQGQLQSQLNRMKSKNRQAAKLTVTNCDIKRKMKKL